METKIKVLIADAGEDYRALITEAINAEEDMEVVGSAADGAEAIELIAQNRPDVLLMDLVLLSSMIASANIAFVLFFSDNANSTFQQNCDFVEIFDRLHSLHIQSFS